MPSLRRACGLARGLPPNEGDRLRYHFHNGVGGDFGITFEALLGKGHEVERGVADLGQEAVKFAQREDNPNFDLVLIL